MAENPVSGPIARGYEALLDRPWWLLAGTLVVCLIAGFYSTRFSFDASSETLVVDGDPDLAAYRQISETFGGDEFLLMTFTPAKGMALAEDNLDHLRALADDVRRVPGVRGVFSVLDAPLLKSPPVPLAELSEGYRTLDSPDVDLDLALDELSSSPLFRELLISTDGRTTAMRIDLDPEKKLQITTEAREILRQQSSRTSEEAERLSALNVAYREQRQDYLARRAGLVAEMRRIVAERSGAGLIHLGGVPMIAADMIDFVKSDMVVFGVSVVLLIMLALYIFFRRWRWVLLPVAASGITILLTMGLLGFLERPATVISSNFVSLLAITTISLTIHLIVRFRELRRTDQAQDVHALVRETMTSKFAPCLYTSLTTMAAFGSLTASRIVPVEDFGWMMCIGIGLAFIVTFTFFPAALRLLSIGDFRSSRRELGVTRVLGDVARWRAGSVLVIALALAVLVAFGINRISLDNRFVDYFKDDTDINRGMVYIDQNLGGTIPFDVVVQFPAFEAELEGDEDDFFAEEEEDAYPERYWFTRAKLNTVQALHDYIEARPEVGKVVSIASLEQLAREYTDGRPLSGVEIAGVLGLLPPNIRDELIRPYASPSTGELRINVRIIETGPSFDRDQLVADIRQFAETELALAPDQLQIAGMLLLFNSMLVQLFDSQVDTLAYVLAATFVMFVVLLRSVMYALLGLLPNILAAASVVAFMGYAGIPLDMMTTTIAAISIGIGVDNAIHYLHRFRGEHEKWRDVRIAVAWSHASTGRALYFTGVTIILGFSVLVFSNFVPTVMFGVLTAIAMALALLANLTLMPSLLVLVHGRRKASPQLSG